jgi:dTDP-glucose 4,6-dehydratase
MAKMTFIVTGGAGFIGRHLVKNLRNRYPDSHIIVLDKLGIGSDKKSIRSYDVEFIELDLSDRKWLGVFCTTVSEPVDCVFHLAAESHVDRSITSPNGFLDSNVTGTFNILFGLQNKYKKFMHVSTDEVYGSLNIDSDPSKETDPLLPSSIYSSTKASSDLIVLASYHTNKFPVIVTRCCNNYGPGQNDEKFIPVILNSALNDRNIPVYGNGTNVREWIYVDDHANAIIDLSEKGEIGEIYNIGSAYRLDNISLAKHILKILNKPESLISFVTDRLGHDICYKLDSAKTRSTINLPKYDEQRFLQFLKQTVEKHILSVNKQKGEIPWDCSITSK